MLIYATARFGEGSFGGYFGLARAFDKSMYFMTARRMMRYRSSSEIYFDTPLISSNILRLYSFLSVSGFCSSMLVGDRFFARYLPPELDLLDLAFRGFLTAYSLCFSVGNYSIGLLL